MYWYICTYGVAVVSGGSREDEQVQMRALRLFFAVGTLHRRWGHIAQVAGENAKCDIQG